jgi:ferredoxin-type protein NapH
VLGREAIVTTKLRQRLRSGALLLSLLLFPVTLNYLSPYLIVEGASSGFLSGSAVMFGVMFAASLVVGRLWCAWVCPGAGLMEFLFGVQPKRLRRRGADLVKWLIWVPWLTAIVVLFVRAGGPSAVRFFHRMDGGVSTQSPLDFIRFYAIVLLFVVPSLLLGRRGGCHALCWMSPFMIVGNAIGRAARLPRLHLEAESDACGKCRTCETKCPMSLEVPKMVASGSMYNAECILCGSCVDHCPKGVMHYAFRVESDTGRPPASRQAS